MLKYPIKYKPGGGEENGPVNLYGGCTQIFSYAFGTKDAEDFDECFRNKNGFKNIEGAQFICNRYWSTILRDLLGVEVRVKNKGPIYIYEKSNDKKNPIAPRKIYRWNFKTKTWVACCFFYAIGDKYAPHFDTTVDDLDRVLAVKPKMNPAFVYRLYSHSYETKRIYRYHRGKKKWLKL